MRLINPLRRFKLIIHWQSGSVELCLWNHHGLVRHEAFLLRESSESAFVLSVQRFLGGVLPRESVLVLSRSEVLQKEIQVSTSGDLKRNIENKLRQILPYSPKEMAYGVSLRDSNSESSKVLLYAAPEKKIKDTLGLLLRCGLKVSEVVSEDQALTLFYSRYFPEASPLVIVDKTVYRWIVILAEGSNVLYSVSFGPGPDDFEAVWSELSIRFIEAPPKALAVVAGGVSGEEREMLESVCKVQVQKIEERCGESLNYMFVGQGMSSQSSIPYISLLPTEMKIKRWRRTLESAFVLCVGAWLFFLISLGCLFKAHESFISQREAQLDVKLLAMAPHVKEAQKKVGFKQLAIKSLDSGKRGLELVKDLAEKIPFQVRLVELQMDSKRILFKGECSSHAVIGEVVQAFEGLPILIDSKLEHTRSLKRINQDYFEFEISSRWRQ